MCIAAIATSGGFSPETLTKFFRTNDDGGGFSYAENGIIHTIRHILTEDEYLEIGASLASKTNLVTHCRIATSGTITQSNAHPFPLGEEASLVHNGVLFYGAESGKSDTLELVESGIELLKNEELMTQPVCVRVGDIIGRSNKFIILYNTGNFKIINESMGYWETLDEKKVWYSNLAWKHTPVTPLNLTTPYYGETSREAPWDIEGYPYNGYN